MRGHVAAVVAVMLWAGLAASAGAEPALPASAASAAPDASAPRVRVSAALIEETLFGHPQVGRADADVDKARALRFRADAAYIPRANVRATFALLPGMRGSPFAGFTDTSEIGPFLNLGVDFGFPLIASGQLFALRDLGTAMVGIAEARRTSARRQVERDAVILYARWRSSFERRAPLATLDAALSRLEAHVDELDESMHPDFDPVDVLTLRVHRADWEQARVEIERDRAVAEAALRALLRLPDDAVLEPPVTDDPEARAVLRSFGARPDIEQLQEQAIHLRPEVQLAAAAFEAADANVRLRITQFFPGLAVVGQANIRRALRADIQRGVFNRDPYSAIGGGAALGMRWHLHLGERIGELREALARREQARALYDAWRFTLRMELASAFAELERQRERVAALADAEIAAQGWLAAMQTRYFDGRVRLGSVLFALRQAMSVTSRIEEAWLDYRRASASLEQLAGQRPAL